MLNNRVQACLIAFMNYVAKNISNLLRPSWSNLKRTLVSESLTSPTKMAATAANPARLSEPNFDYFLVLDFEATCDSPKQLQPMEIIEFPVLKVNSRTLQVEDIFHRYVRPTVNPQLTDFCIDLTGILQEMVDRSDRFNIVFKQFQCWMRTTELINNHNKPLKPFTFVTCGDWDLKKMLPLQCRTTGFEIPDYMTKWIDVKKAFHHNEKHWPRSQKSLLDHFEICPVGRAHSGIDDCHNLLKILHQMVIRGYDLRNTSRFKEA